MLADEARRYSRIAGFNSWERVYGIDGRCWSINLPKRRSCAEFTTDHRKHTATASMSSATKRSITRMASESSKATRILPSEPIRSVTSYVKRRGT
jgi:hypothetical protein